MQHHIYDIVNKNDKIKKKFNLMNLKNKMENIYLAKRRIDRKLV